MEDRQVRKVADVKEFKMTELDQYLFGQGRHYNIYKNNSPVGGSFNCRFDDVCCDKFVEYIF